MARGLRAAPVARAVRPDSDPDLPSNTCGAQVDAMLKQAEATERLAAAGETVALAIRDAAEVVKPLADGVHGLFEAQQKLCQFIVGNRLKLAASVPVVLVAIGAISPNAARALGEFLKTWGIL